MDAGTSEFEKQERVEARAIMEKWRGLPCPMAPDQLANALLELKEALTSIGQGDDLESRRARSACSMILANIQRDHGRVTAALSDYAAAMLDAAAWDDGSPSGKNELANIVSNHGICLLSLGDIANLSQALAYFNRAISLRADLPFDEDPQYRWGLAAGYMNRGDVLHRMGGRSAEAVEAYDLAIRHLELFPADDTRDWIQRLGLAWSNRGLAADDPTEALRSFAECTGLITSPANPRQLLTLCTALLNHGGLLVREFSDFSGAAGDARSVLGHLQAQEEVHPAAAGMTLQARHLLCRTLCVWLEEPERGQETTRDWIAETTDSIEEALKLERHWSQRGQLSFRPLAAELFALGVRVYRVCQPHFLAEFILESMDPELSAGAPSHDSVFQAIAVRGLKEGLDDAVSRAAASTLDPQQHMKEMEILHRLKKVDLKLARLQSERITRSI